MIYDGIDSQVQVGAAEFAQGPVVCFDLPFVVREREVHGRVSDGVEEDQRDGPVVVEVGGQAQDALGVVRDRAVSEELADRAGPVGARRCAPGSSPRAWT